MFELAVKGHFDAAHHLNNYVGKCANIHGHTWDVEVLVHGEVLDETGMLIDFGVLKALLKEQLDAFDHQYINNLADFSDGKLNPTAENLCKYIFQNLNANLKEAYPQVRLYQVKVWESPQASASFKG